MNDNSDQKRQGTLTVWDVTLMNLVAVTSLRWLASAASSGPSSLVLWVLAAICFFVPEGMAVAHLSARYPGQGGLYKWTQRAFGDRHAFLCGWCYWVNNLLYFPALLLYVAANVAFLLEWRYPGQHFSTDKLFVVTITLGTLWLVSLLTFFGMKAGKWLQNLGAVGNWVPAITVTLVGAYLFVLFGSATPFSVAAMIPNFASTDQWSFFSQMCFALAGLELISFLGSDVKDPKRTLPRGLLIAAVLIVSIYLVGTLGILVCVRPDQINLLNGILLPVELAGQKLHLPWLSSFCAVFVALAGVGAVMAWFAGAARIPYLAGVDSYLPSSFGKLHPKFETPYVAIAVQAIAATVFTLFATVGASTAMESAYKILVDMCLILYFIPYVYLFLSQGKLGVKEASEPSKLRAQGRFALAGLGLATTVFAIVLSLIPTGNSGWLPTLKVAAGTLVMLAVGLALYLRGEKNRVKLAA